jgi:hypothetical protein
MAFPLQAARGSGYRSQRILARPSRARAAPGWDRDRRCAASIDSGLRRSACGHQDLRRRAGSERYRISAWSQNPPDVAPLYRETRSRSPPGPVPFGSFSKPLRAALRQAWGDRPWRRATSETNAPGANDSATIAAAWSAKRQRSVRPSGRPTKSGDLAWRAKAGVSSKVSPRERIAICSFVSCTTGVTRTVHVSSNNATRQCHQMRRLLFANKS